jgi:hypothetical protein
MGLNIGGYDPLSKGGLPKPGKAHFLVADTEDDDSKPSYKVTYEVIAHEDPEEVGRKVYDYLARDGGGARRLENFAKATDLITQEDVNNAIENQQDEIEFDIADAEGQTFFATLKKGSYKKDGETIETCRIAFDYRHPSDPEAADFPRNTEYVEAPETAPAGADTDDGGNDGPF